MKTIYEFEMRADKLNDYQRGHITGLIDALTGMPDKLFVWENREDGVSMARLQCTKDQFISVLEAIGKAYPDVLL